MNPMECLFQDEAVNAVLTYLRRTGKALTRIEDEYALTYGTPDIGVVKQAFSDSAISVQEDGTILVCGVSFSNKWDTAKIRRKIEGHLRKTASDEEIIRIAACLGLK